MGSVRQVVFIPSSRSIAALGQLALQRLAEYNPATIEEDPYAARDLLKKLYHYLMPRELRHDLGEYYTPDWLATRVLRQLGEPLYVVPEGGRQVRVISVSGSWTRPVARGHF